MKKQFVMAVILVSLLLSNLVYAEVINGSFETGDLTGWEFSLTFTSEYSWSYWDAGGAQQTSTPPFTTSEMLAAYSRPPAVVTSNNAYSYNVYFPVDGNYFLKLTNYEGPLTIMLKNRPPDDPDPSPIVYTYHTGSMLKMTQNVFMYKGQTLSGWAAYFTTDWFAHFDPAWISISNEITSELLWYKDSTTGVIRKDMGGYFSDSAYSDWQYWNWTAPSTGLYKLAFNMAGDDEEWAQIYVDGIRVPEPSTMLLLGFGLVGLAGFSRRKFKSN